MRIHTYIYMKNPNQNHPLKMPPEENQPFLPSLFSSSTMFSDVFNLCCACFPRMSSRVNYSVTEAQPQENQTKWLNDLKDERISFLSGLFKALKEQSPTDTLLQPGDGGPSIPAHRVLLATISVTFKEMLNSDGFEAKDGIRVPELNSEELESLHEFLYSGDLPLEKLEKHVHPLFVASEKYEIPSLQEFCQCYMMNSLNKSNVLDVLETSEICSNKALNEMALNFIILNDTRAIVLSKRYEDLAAKYPHLCMQFTRKLMGSFDKSSNNLQASNDEEEIKK